MSESIGKNLQRLRENVGLTTRQLARRADMADQTVITIENGTANPTYGTLAKIAEVLGCKVHDIVGDE